MFCRARGDYASRQEEIEILQAPPRELLFGITGAGVVHLAGDNPDVDTRFAMVRDAGVFDYFDRTPP
ncbi:MAG: hypothetical protein ABI460_01845, partial [Caldimonas sp.]